MFDFDDESFSSFGGERDRAPRETQWVATCEPLTTATSRNKAPRGPGRKKKRSKARSLEPTGAQEPWMPELPPHLLRYKMNHKYDFGGPSLLGVEDDEGRVEYKLRLKDPTPTRFQQLVTQLKWRLSEGGGECFYFIGVEDNGHPQGLALDELQQSLAVLGCMAAEVGAAVTVLRTPEVEGGRQCAVVAVRQRCPEGVDYVDLRIAVAGGVDAGKSTLVAVLTHGSGGSPLLDNGRGSARMNVFRHKHEIESGHTSSISQQMLGYDAQGRVINYSSGTAGCAPGEVAASAARVLRFVDTGGHEKYSKTALHGLTCMLPDYAMLLCACAAPGMSWVTREHLAVALSLGVPAFVVLTKADLTGAEEGALDSLVEDIRCLVGAALAPGAVSATPEALVPVVESEEDARRLAPRMLHSRVGAGQLLVPIFKLSSVTGRGLGPLHAFLHALRPEVDRLEAPAAELAGAKGRGAGRGAKAGQAVDTASAASGLTAASGAGGLASQVAGRAAADAVAESLAGLALAEVSAASSRHALSQGWCSAERQECSSSVGREDRCGEVGGGSCCGAGFSGSGSSSSPVFQVDSSFFVPGVGPVYSGRMVSGSLSLGSRLLLGPSQGAGPSGGWGFHLARVVGLHRSQLPVQSISQGHIATVAVELEEASAALQAGEGIDGSCLEGSTPAAAAAAAAEGAAAPSEQREGAASTAPFLVPAAAAAGTCSSPPSAQQLAVSPAGLPARTAPHLAGTCWDLSEHLEAASPTAVGVAGGGPGRQKPNVPKASALVDPGLRPEAHWEFEATLVLLGGQWPARGLMSGKWPPEEDLGGLAAQEEPRPSDFCQPCGVGTPLVGGEGRLRTGLGADMGAPGAGYSMQRRENAKRPTQASVYAAVVHCGSIRQAAQVLSIQELPLPSPTRSPRAATSPGSDYEGATSINGAHTLPALTAARLLKADGWVPSDKALLVGSLGSLPRLGSSSQGASGGRSPGRGTSPSCGSTGDWSARLASSSPATAACGVPMLRAGSGQALLARSVSGSGGHAIGGTTPGALLGSLGATSSAWSGERGLSYASSDSGGLDYDSSASDGGRSGTGSRGGRRVGWADEAGGPGPDDLQPAWRQGSPLTEPQPCCGPRLLRHSSLTAARHDPDLGCLALVRFRFVKRPEWLLEGARLVVRDRGGGRAAAVGHVRSVGPPSPCLLTMPPS